MTHSPAAAREQGYQDAMNGLCLPEFYECQCVACREAYDAGQRDAIYELANRL
jgi:hypothetical protein